MTSGGDAPSVDVAQVGYQVTRLSLRNDVTMFLFTFVDDGSVANHDADAQRAALRARFAGARWEIPAILERVDDAKTFYCDRVSQLSKQKAAVRLASAFAPHNGMRLLIRNSIMRPFSLPLVARLAMGNSLRDAIDLPTPPSTRGRGRHPET